MRPERHKRFPTARHTALRSKDPVAKQGARGTLRSVYCRDPDGSLIEISSYEGEA